MTTAGMFRSFLKKLILSNREIISLRYGEITTVLNKKFRSTESKTDNSLQVGSFGRGTAIDGISDLDMLYIMPKSDWDNYSDENGPNRILEKVRDAILDRYPKTQISVNRCVVTIQYTDFQIEVQPVFEQEDQSYKYPDTYAKSWKITKPREEMKAISDKDSQTNGNLRNLCKMARAWKNKCEVVISGLLIDTLAFKFLNQTSDYDESGFADYDILSQDFFRYLSEETDKEWYQAPGSNQVVKVKEQFHSKAKKAYILCEAITESEDNKNVNEKWKEIYGRPFPTDNEIKNASSSVQKGYSFDDTEEFIEDRYIVDIEYHLKIDCNVTQDGFRTHSLRYMLQKRLPLFAKRSLKFYIDEIDVPKPYQIKWKVLNCGAEAQRRNMIRGQILDDDGKSIRCEHSVFKGNHIVECYVIKNGLVVAKDSINVPIRTNK